MRRNDVPFWNFSADAKILRNQQKSHTKTAFNSAFRADTSNRLRFGRIAAHAAPWR
jgi:hypothetical protein